VDEVAGALGSHVVPLGGGGSGAMFSGSVVTPFAVVISAEVTPWLPGHQATNQSPPVLASTSSPSLRTSVTPVTAGSTWPSTRV
jgi:hypothetical protein